jgi:uncharacterized membrane protein (UPF0127 family)
VRVANTFWARVLGLAFRSQPPDHALLLPRTRAVHTFGMRFDLDCTGSTPGIASSASTEPCRGAACARAPAPVP